MWPGLVFIKQFSFYYSIYFNFKLLSLSVLALSFQKIWSMHYYEFHDSVCVTLNFCLHKIVSQWSDTQKATEFNFVTFGAWYKIYLSSSKDHKSVHFLTVVFYRSLEFQLFCNISKYIYILRDLIACNAICTSS